MVETKIISTSKSNKVYDISLDGTFINALGENVLHNTDGFDFQLPSTYRYTDENPYIGKGLNRDTVEGKKYTGVKADVAEFDDMILCHTYGGSTQNLSGLGIDEFVDSSINLSRKNYLCLMEEDGSIKKVGNTMKSRKMSGYLQNFINKACNMLIMGNGYGFLHEYYSYIDDIYNYRIPVRDIASRGNIKQTLDSYKASCNTLTKSGSKKARQAWYELAINNNLSVNMGDTIYYVNTGSSKGDGDVKRIVHQYVMDPDNPSEEIELTSKLKTRIIKAYCEENNILYKGMKDSQKKVILKPFIVREEDEIILNCKMVPFDVINCEDDILCSDLPDLEYNVVKYIEQFNKRITPLLVCFHPDIRNEILIKDPRDAKYWTKEQAQLVHGYPMKEGDQDLLEVLMKPERKEIAFWLSINEVPPFVEECGIDWDALVEEYYAILEKEKDELFQLENKKYLDALSKLTQEDIDKFEEEGELPTSLTEIVTIDPVSMKFYFNNIPDMNPSTGGNIFEDLYSDIAYQNFLDGSETY